MDQGKVFEYAGFIAAILSMYQANTLYKSATDRDIKLHEEEIEIMKMQQREEIRSMKQTYLLNSFTDTERHFQQMNADLINSSKEFEKDMVDQRNLWCQTIIIAAAIMLTALVSVLIQGVLVDANTEVYIAYSISNAGSMGCLFLSILLYIEVIHRISNFNIERTAVHEKLLKEAMKKSSEIIGGLRPTTEDDEHHHSHDEMEEEEEIKKDMEPLIPPVPPPMPPYVRGTTGQSEQTEKSYGSSGRAADQTQRKLIARLNSEEFEIEWRSHESLIRKYLEGRDKINDETANIFKTEVGFERYWEKYCETVAVWALLLFYGGTVLMLIAVMVYMYAYYVNTYENDVGAYVAVVFISTGLAGSLVVGYLLHRDRQGIVEDVKRENVLATARLSSGSRSQEGLTR
jgi:hypothetical protein